MARVLLVTYSCRPAEGGESGIGWYTAISLAHHHEVTVLTRPANRASIESHSRREALPLEFAYTQVTPLERLPVRGLMISNLRYYFWQRHAGRIARELHEKRSYDLVQHVTWARCWTPAGAVMAGPPLIWGPVGGGEPLARPFLRELTPRARMAEIVRSMMSILGGLDPLTRRTLAEASARIASSRDTIEWIERHGYSASNLLPQVGVDLEEIGSAKAEEPWLHEFLSVGRLLGWKGFNLALRAFALSGLNSATFGIVGDGPERSRLEAIAREHRMDDRVRFYGQVPRERVFELMARSGALVHPSFHDSGPFVAVEAMALGKPVICLDRGGPGLLVDDTSGYRIKPTNPQQVISDLAEAMRRLVEEPDTYRELSEGARRRVESELTWEVKADALSRIYEEVLKARQDL